MKKRIPKKPRNIVAADLRTPKYSMRVVKPKKGKGSFDRNSEKREVDATVAKDELDK